MPTYYSWRDISWFVSEKLSECNVRHHGIAHLRIFFKRNQWFFTSVNIFHDLKYCNQDQLWKMQLQRPLIGCVFGSSYCKIVKKSYQFPSQFPSMNVQLDDINVLLTMGETKPLNLRIFFYVLTAMPRSNVQYQTIRQHAILKPRKYLEKWEGKWLEEFPNIL